MGLFSPRNSWTIVIDRVCSCQIHDINTGRWTTPDPAASPWSNLQDYVGNNPISRSDPSGLSQTVSIATEDATDRSHKNADGSYHDPVTEAARQRADGVSGSVKDFLHVIAKKYNDCLVAGGSFCKCCISKIRILGHEGAGYGGGRKIMSRAQQTGLTYYMCACGVTIENLQCRGGQLGSRMQRKGEAGANSENLHKTDFKLQLLEFLSRFDKGAKSKYIGSLGSTWYPKDRTKPITSDGDILEFPVVGAGIMSGSKLEDPENRKKHNEKWAKILKDSLEAKKGKTPQLENDIPVK